MLTALFGNSIGTHKKPVNDGVRVRLPAQVTNRIMPGLPYYRNVLGAKGSGRRCSNVLAWDETSRSASFGYDMALVNIAKV